MQDYERRFGTDDGFLVVTRMEGPRPDCEEHYRLHIGGKSGCKLSASAARELIEYLKARLDAYEKRRWGSGEWLAAKTNEFTFSGILLACCDGGRPRLIEAMAERYPEAREYWIGRALYEGTRRRMLDVALYQPAVPH